MSDTYKFNPFTNTLDIVGDTGGGGGGDVSGPAGATDNAAARFNGSSGLVLQDSNVIISDNGKVQINPTAGANTSLDLLVFNNAPNQNPAIRWEDTTGDAGLKFKIGVSEIASLSDTGYFSATGFSTGTIFLSGDSLNRDSSQKLAFGNIGEPAIVLSDQLAHALYTGIVQIQGGGVAVPILQIKGAASQTGDTLQILNSSNGLLAQFGAGGHLTFTPPNTSGEFNIIDINNAATTSPRIQWDNGDLFFRAGATNVVIFDAAGKIFANEFIAGLTSTYSSGGITVAAAGTILFDTIPDPGTAAFTFGSSGAGIDHLTIEQITINKASNRGLIIKGATSQTANLLEFRNSSNTILSFIDAAGVAGGALASSGANTSLSNLTTTSINTSLLPDSDVSRNFGSPTLKWDQSYVYTANAYGYNLKDWPIGNVQYGRLGPNGSINGTQGAVTLLSELTPDGTSPSYGLILGIASTNPTKDLLVTTANQSGITGDVNFISGNSSANNSGSANIASGNASGSGKVSGPITIYSGSATSGANSGVIELGTGTINSGAGNSGSLTAFTGDAPSGNSGNINLTTGAAGTTRGQVTVDAPKFELISDRFTVPTTVTAGGTTGAQTINKISGTVNFAAATSSLVVTNSFVTANSIVFAVIRTNDTTATIKSVVPAAGSFTIRLGAATTAETSVGFFVVNG